ncbi:hypothetical protein D3C84_695780 [compost metagenome]
MQPALPAASRDQLNFFTAGGNVDFQHMFNVEKKIKNDDVVLRNHHIAQIKILAWPNSKNMLPGVLPRNHVLGIGSIELISNVERFIFEGLWNIENSLLGANPGANRVPPETIETNVITRPQ